MILVTLGTQKQPFTRLLNYIEKSNINDKVVVQAGHTKFSSEKMEIFDFINYDEMDELINKADIIITHGGTGSILTPLKKEKKVIACSRLAKYGEHVDNHQCEIVGIFAKEGYILELNDENNLDEIMQLAKKMKPKKYISNTEVFLEKLEKIIND